MHREPGSDLIFFDDDDKRDYPALKDKPFVPIEAAPGLLQEIIDAQEANMVEIQKLNSGINDRSYVEYLADVQPFHAQSIRMQRVAAGLGELAGAEIIEAMLPHPA